MRAAGRAEDVEVITGGRGRSVAHVATLIAMLALLGGCRADAGATTPTAVLTSTSRVASPTVAAPVPTTAPPEPTPTEATPTESAPAPEPPAAAPAPAPAPAVAPPPAPAPAEASAPAPAVNTDPRFPTCKAAIKAGYGPYRQGIDPEYDWYRDADHDGIDCER